MIYIGFEIENWNVVGKVNFFVKVKVDIIILDGEIFVKEVFIQLFCQCCIFVGIFFDCYMFNGSC